MTSPARALQAADGSPLDVDALVDALSGHLQMESGARQVVRRTRLDTFDRRLVRAGLTLQHEAGASTESLVLGRADSSTVTAPGPAPTWPAFAADLPPGALRDEIAPVTGIRALMVLTEERRRVRRVQLRNDDAKVVVRLEVDEPASSASTSPPTVVVRPLRGYESQAAQVTRLLTASGLRPAPDGDEQPPAVHPAYDVDRDAPATDLLVLRLTEFLTAMRENLPGLLDDVDTEFLHDFRVAVRRTRSTLKLGRPALTDVAQHRWEPDFKRLGDLTTPVRDLDVYELDLPTMSGWLVAAAPDDLEPFAVHLRRRRTAERRRLVRALRSAKFDRLVTDWQDTLGSLADIPPDEVRAPSTAGELADRSISWAYRRVTRKGSAISAGSPAEDLHSLRKRCKDLRYALEVFAPVITTAPRKQAVTDLKKLQDVLGRFQDSEVQRQALRSFAEEMMADGTPAAAVLAMGELIGHLDTEQDRARHDFDGAFSRFVRPSSDRRMRQLGGAR